MHGGEEDKVVRENEKLIPEGLTLEDVLYPENPKKAPVYQFVEKYRGLCL